MTISGTSGDAGDLVAAARAGDPDAFARLVDRYWPVAFATAYGWLGNRAAAEDAAQDAFITVYQGLDALQEPEAFAVWLRRITVTACDRITRRKRVPTVSLETIDQVEPAPEAAHDPAHSAERADEQARVLLAVEALPPDLRLPLVLHHLGELTVAEVAELLELPVTTVKGRIQLAMRRLRTDFDALVVATLDAMVVRRPPHASHATQLFLAIRADDTRMVRRLLDAEPELVDATEDWSIGLAQLGQLPFPNHGTPLARAVERGDPGVIAVLLRAGADPDRRCARAVGETPLLTAVIQDDGAALEQLLDAGADPDVAAGMGQTPLHVAAQRGHTKAAKTLRARGADVDRVDASGRRPIDWARHNGHGAVIALLPAESAEADRAAPARSDPADALLITGIRALDLMAPLERGARMLWEGRTHVGQMALLVELSHNLARRSACEVIWTGVPQGALDRRDYSGELSEANVADHVHLVMNERKDPSSVRDAVTRALTRADRAREGGRDGVVVLFSETGSESATDLLVGRCTPGAPGSPGSITGIVVTSWVPSSRAGATAAPPFTGFVAFDSAAAECRVYPALDLTRSSSNTLDGSLVSSRHRALAAALRDLDDQERRFQFLAQPFDTRQALQARPGEFSTREQTLSAAEEVLDG